LGEDRRKRDLSSDPGLSSEPVLREMHHCYVQTKFSGRTRVVRDRCDGLGAAISFRDETGRYALPRR
jgi:hypothetical protein